MSEENVIKNPVPKNFQKRVESISPVKNGVIGTDKVIPKAKQKATVKKIEEPYEKVALFSSRNVSWPGIGQIKKGYNIVSRESAEKWLSRDHIREATPQEIAEEFGL